jgi:hypothetical protein
MDAGAVLGNCAGAARHRQPNRRGVNSSKSHQCEFENEPTDHRDIRLFEVQRGISGNAKAPSRGDEGQILL